MAPTVRTLEGKLAAKAPAGTANDFTQEEAEANAAERNARAEKMDIKTRYEVTEA